MKTAHLYYIKDVNNGAFSNEKSNISLYNLLKST